MRVKLFPLNPAREIYTSTAGAINDRVLPTPQKAMGNKISCFKFVYFYAIQRCYNEYCCENYNYYYKSDNLLTKNSAACYNYHYLNTSMKPPDLKVREITSRLLKFLKAALIGIALWPPGHLDFLKGPTFLNDFYTN